MAIATNLGFPRIGARRELKAALESFWSGAIDEGELQGRAAEIRRVHWRLQQGLGLDHIPSGDFSLYDHVLDAAALVGAVPARYRWKDAQVDLATYFAMARGGEVPALEMTKWFDTNYHYLVPELTQDLHFRSASTKPLDEFREARAQGIHTRPVLLGPVSFLRLAKVKSGGLDPLSWLHGLLPVYEETLSRLAEAGADWVQVDEPCLVLDLDDDWRGAVRRSHARLAGVSPRLRLLVATYFGDLGANLSTALRLPAAALHLDLVRAPALLERALGEAPPGLSLSLGLVDGRNVWRSDLDRALRLALRAQEDLGTERVLVAPSCSLLHVPVDLESERGLDPEVHAWLAFARQKLEEVALIARGLNEGPAAVEELLSAQRAVLQGRGRSPRTRHPPVRDRLAGITPDAVRRASPYPVRRAAQAEKLGLPELPTTTIGSFPQTAGVRSKRASFQAGRLPRQEYEAFLRAQVEGAIRLQEEVGLDVLVHGEFERTDMVEYFAERLEGFLVTRHGWVQSYGSRCVRPPIVFGDVWRKAPMTVEWARHAQSLASRPVKGMLTGPVTLLQWSFVRDDLPRPETCRQIALAIRDEVGDLEAAGLAVIQIDEPALREGLPLPAAEWPGYLEWAVAAFRLASSGVRDETQIHTHMCYAEFGDIIGAVADLDADVLSLEASRSQMELLDVFARTGYGNEIGPGVYDIHSPRIPTAAEMEQRLARALRVLRRDQLWVNPDCGLKTRG
jgi:5-methyltetrahydropteroyltriglutamate--homocysteine methyltransferase